MFACGLLRNKLYDIRIDFEELQVNSRNTVLTAEKVRDLLIREQTHLDQNGSKPATSFSLLPKRLSQLVMINDFFPNQEIAQSLRHTLAFPDRIAPVSTIPFDGLDNATATARLLLIVTRSRAPRTSRTDQAINRRMCEVTFIVNAERLQTEEGKLLSY